MSLSEKMRFAKAYRDLGDAVAAQLDDLLQGDSRKCNINAVRLIQTRLGKLDEDINAACQEWLEDHPF